MFACGHAYYKYYAGYSTANIEKATLYVCVPSSAKQMDYTGPCHNATGLHYYVLKTAQQGSLQEI